MYWFLYDLSGNIKEAHKNDTSAWTNLNGYAGAFGAAETDAMAQSAFLNPSLYLVQSGELAQVLNYAILQLAQAQQAQSTKLMDGYNSTLDAGFTSSATGVAITYGWQQLDQLHLDMVQEAITQGTETFPVPYADINGNEVSITSQAQLTQLDADATNFSWAQVKQVRALAAQVMAATTMSAVQDVVWTPAT